MFYASLSAKFQGEETPKTRRSSLLSVPALLSQKIVVLDIPSTQERIDFQKLDTTVMMEATKKEMESMVDSVKKEAEVEYRALYKEIGRAHV